MIYEETYSPELEMARQILTDMKDVAKSDAKQTAENDLGRILGALQKYFRSIGQLHSNVDDLPLPKDYPQSSRFGKILDNLVYDIYEIFAEQEALEMEIARTENIGRAQRQAIDDLEKKVRTIVLSSIEQTISEDSNTIVISDTFSSGDQIDPTETDSTSMFNEDEGAICLEATSEVRIPIQDAKWVINKELSRINFDAVSAIDEWNQKFNLYTGHKYGELEELYKDTPVESLQNPADPETDTQFSRFELTLGEPQRKADLINYFEREARKIYRRARTSDPVVVHPEIIYKAFKPEEFRYYDRRVGLIELVADLNITLPEETDISSIRITQKARGNTHDGATRVREISLYGAAGRITGTAPMKAAENTMIMRTMNVAGARVIRITFSKSNLGNQRYLPYYVKFTPRSYMRDIQLEEKKLRMIAMFIENVDPETKK